MRHELTTDEFRTLAAILVNGTEIGIGEAIAELGHDPDAVLISRSLIFGRTGLRQCGDCSEWSMQKHCPICFESRSPPPVELAGPTPAQDPFIRRIHVDGESTTDFGAMDGHGYKIQRKYAHIFLTGPLPDNHPLHELARKHNWYSPAYPIIVPASEYYAAVRTRKAVAHV